MERLQLKPGQFARILEINPAIISHILAERNKPGVDLLQKILIKFPQVNPDWLLLDSEEMFRPTPTHGPSVAEQASDAANSNGERLLFASGISEHIEQTSELLPNSPNPPAAPNTKSTQSSSGISTDHAITNKPISRVVLFYADGSFESFIPKSND